MFYPRFILAGAHSGVGKTTLALGIMSALRERGLKVQPFKAGPDYIDPTYHAQAAGRFSCNLDSWLLSQGAILELFKWRAENADLSVVEGVMGLYDGLQDTEKGSTAHLAKLLNCPVILILDGRSLSRSAGAVALGYREFDKKVKVKGFILNNIGSEEHYRYIKNSVEKKTGIPVLGYLARNPDLKLPQRHLGLVPRPEMKLGNAFYRKLSGLIEKGIDLDKIYRISRRAPMLPSKKRQLLRPKPISEYVTIAVARDKAFNFYYQDNLDILKFFGARLVEFSPLTDKKLPADIDGVYIGGGFPELFAHQLSKNARLKREIRQGAKDGLPIYAECGGLMYLVERLVDFKKRVFPMVGIFKGTVTMAHRLQALGYVNIEAMRDSILSKAGTKVRAHIFHWSYLDDVPEGLSFAYKISRPFLPQERSPSKKWPDYDGLVQQKVLASYAHLHFASDINLARNFIANCREYRRHDG